MGLGGITSSRQLPPEPCLPAVRQSAVRKVMWKLVDRTRPDGDRRAEQYRSKSCHRSGCAARRSPPTPAPASQGRLAAAKAELKASGYKGEPVIASSRGLDQPDGVARAGPEHARRGLHRRTAAGDWPTVLARPRQEGRLVDVPRSTPTAPTMYSPLTHFYVAATCNDFPGWSATTAFPTC